MNINSKNIDALEEAFLSYCQTVDETTVVKAEVDARAVMYVDIIVAEKADAKIKEFGHVSFSEAAGDAAIELLAKMRNQLSKVLKPDSPRTALVTTKTKLWMYILEAFSTKYDYCGIRMGEALLAFDESLMNSPEQAAFEKLLRQWFEDPYRCHTNYLANSLLLRPNPCNTFVARAMMRAICRFGTEYFVEALIARKAP
jgi:hypothetical protein